MIQNLTSPPQISPNRNREEEMEADELPLEIPTCESHDASSTNSSTEKAVKMMTVQAEPVSTTASARPSLGTSSSRKSASYRGLIRGSTSLLRTSDVERSEKMIMKSAAAVVASNKKAKKFQRLAFIATSLAVVAFCGVFATVLLGNEVTKEMKTNNNAHELRTPAGDLVTTGEAVSYSTLFDIPNFDAETLSHLKTLTLKLQDTQRVSAATSHQASFQIVGAFKTDGTQACTLFTAEGGEIVIDKAVGLAFASVRGHRYKITGEARRRALQKVGDSSAAPRLHSAHEFFTQEFGFVISHDRATGQPLARRLSSDSDLSGFASFAISAAAGLLDWANEQANEQAGAAVYSSVFVEGKLSAIDDESADDNSMYVRVFYTAFNNYSFLMSNPATEARTALAFASPIPVESGDQDNVTHLTYPYTGLINYHYTEAGALSRCALSVHDSANFSKEIMTDTLTISSATSMAASDGRLIVTDESAGFVLQVVRCILDPTAEDMAEVFSAPSGAACAEANGLDEPFEDEELMSELSNATLDGEEESETDEHGRRLSDTISTWWAKQYWYASRYAYKQPECGAPWGWQQLAVCENGNAFARILRQHGKTVLAFAGTDDWRDGIDDIKLWTTTLGDGVQLHKGFVDHANKLFGCIRNKTYHYDYIVGHSLGGATATAYYRMEQALGRTASTYGVVTFGAPRTRFRGSCGVPGTRIYNEWDAVTSLPNSYYHDVQYTRKAYHRCATCTFWGQCGCFKRCGPFGWGRCWRSGWYRKKLTPNMGNMDSCNNGGGFNLNFTYHSNYGDYLG